MSQIQYTCVLCDIPVRAMHRFCSKHFVEYGERIHEPWLKYLLETQRTQRFIDKHECYTLSPISMTDIRGIAEKHEYVSKKDVGRPSTHWRLVNQVLEIYDASVEETIAGKTTRIKSLRAIARELNNRIGYCTVRNILKEYRNKNL